MAALFNRLFQGQAQRGQDKGEDVYPCLGDDQPRNPFTEVTILSGHISTVHQIIEIDDTRLISASNDGSAIVWDIKTGQKLHTLDGHKHRVTSVLTLPFHSDTPELCVMTASADMTIRVWNLNIDDPFQENLPKVVTEHNGLIKCLVLMNYDMVCSGGKDICLWDRNCRLLSKFNRSDLEETSDVHTLLKLDSRHFGVVAASDYMSLAVYDIKKLTMTETDEYELEFVRYLMNSHKENITCLATVSTNFFASGSRDGVILLWSINTLSAMKMFNCSELSPGVQVKDSAPSPYTLGPEIRHILAIGERYLFVGVGCGFKVYDVLTYEDSKGHPKALAAITNAHHQPVTSLDFLPDRAILVTASEDGSVRLWGHPTRISKESDGTPHVNENSSNSSKIHIEDFLGLELNPAKNKRRGGPTIPVKPALLGECLLHSSSVKVIKGLGDYGLVTCGTDNMIIIWKDEHKVREIRDSEITTFLRDSTF